MLLNLILFVQYNKKGLDTILNRRVQHDRLIPGMKLVPFQGLKYTSTACLLEMEVKTKRNVKYMGKAHTLNIYF